MQIRPATQDDIPAVLDIVAPILRAGDTYAIDTDMTDDDVIAYWMGKDKVTLVAEEDGAVVGTYYIRQNQGGGGSHVCNCGYMTAPAASGRGIVHLWPQLGFEIVGRLPGAFMHPTLGETDALVMYRKL